MSLKPYDKNPIGLRPESLARLLREKNQALAETAYGTELWGKKALLSQRIQALPTSYRSTQQLNC